MKVIASLLFLISFNCHALEYIDEQSVEDFLAQEKRFTQNKDLEGIMSLFSEDFSGTDKSGSPISKEDFRKRAMANFMNVSKLLHSSKIKSLSISEDKKSADVILDNETKVLIEVGNNKIVQSSASTTKSLLILENGSLKYKVNSYLSSKH